MTEKEQQINDSLQSIAREIQKRLPEGAGFCLLAYEFGDEEGRRLMYVSNSDREDVKSAMLEFINKVDKGAYGKHVE